MKNFLDIRIILILCVAPGLLPFQEPHIWGKLKWVLGGAHGMQAIDWFDFIMHGAPWILLIVYLVNLLISLFRSKNSSVS